MKAPVVKQDALIREFNATHVSNAVNVTHHTLPDMTMICPPIHYDHMSKWILTPKSRYGLGNADRRLLTGLKNLI